MFVDFLNDFTSLWWSFRSFGPTQPTFRFQLFVPFSNLFHRWCFSGNYLTSASIILFEHTL